VSGPQDSAASEAQDAGPAVRSDADSPSAADEPAMSTAANAQADGQAEADSSAGPEMSPEMNTAASTEDDSPAAGPGAPRTGRQRKNRRRSFWRELPILIAVALLLAVIIKTYAIQAFYIPSGSMENTLEINDRVLVNKIVYHTRDIHRGDIVVFNGDGSWDPGSIPVNGNFIKQFADGFASMFGFGHSGDILIKRVIGIPGDHVACCDAQGFVTVNGVPLHEQSYLYPGSAPSLTRFNIRVPPGRLWVMGDNRTYSDDSRDHQGDPGGGTVPESAVIGRAFIIIWPPSRWRILPIPATFNQPALNGSHAVSPPAVDLLSARAEPTGQAIPLVLGFAGAVPLTWLQRQARIRIAARRRRGRTGPPRSGQGTEPPG
jgi:signal peptidase I